MGRSGWGRLNQQRTRDKAKNIDRSTIRKPETDLTKAKAPYYNRDVQGLNTSTIRDQKSQKKQSKQDNMAGHKRNSIWRNP